MFQDENLFHLLLLFVFFVLFFFVSLVSRVDAQLEFCISASLQIIQMYVNIVIIIIGFLLARKKLKANSSSIVIVFFFTPC